MSESLAALRRANPRRRIELEQSLEAATRRVRAQLVTHVPAETGSVNRARRLRVLRASVATVVLALVTVAVFLAVGSNGTGPGVEDAAAAVRKAANVSASSAERSGTAVIRITRGGELWAGSTIRWHDGDLAVSSDAPRRHGRPGSQLLLVGGTMYGIEDGGWVILGSPESIDPGSGTTPAEYLAAVREDVGGATLRRIVDHMTGLTTRQLGDGSVVYSGTVPAGLVARETGFKGGQAIRVLPFGYVAHDEAADPAAPLHVGVTVGADGIVREIVVSWGTSPSRWTYAVTYTGLGATKPLVAPANARPLRERIPRGP